MMDLFLRPGEESARRGPERRVGVMVSAAGKRAFFPGGDPAAAMVLARAAVPADVLDAPDTRVEFGVAFGAAWAPGKVLKHGAG